MCSRPVGHKGAHSAAPDADTALLDACNKLSWAVAARARAAEIYGAVAVALADARAELVECDARYADARALVASLLGPAATLTGDAASRILGDG